MRIVLLALVVITVWDPVGALIRHEVSWSQAVDAIFTNKVVGLLIVLLALSLVLTLLRSPLVRGAIAVGSVAVVILLLNGTLTLGQIGDTVASFDLQNKLQAVAGKCGYDVTMENVASGVRAVLKDGTEIVGYVEDASQFDPETCTASS